MHVTNASPETLAATLAGLLAKGHSVADITLEGALPAEARTVLKDLMETIDEQEMRHRRLAQQVGQRGSAVEMLQHAEAAEDLAAGAARSFALLLARLEDAGATIKLRPNLAPAGPKLDVDAEACAIRGFEIHVRPLAR